jgi:hypothetical protein
MPYIKRKNALQLVVCKAFFDRFLYSFVYIFGGFGSVFMQAVCADCLNAFCAPEKNRP